MQWPAYLLVIAVGVPAAIVDVKRFVIPDALVLPGIAAAGILLFVSAPVGPIVRLSEAAVTTAVLLSVRMATGGKLGYGDVKLVGFLSLCLGGIGTLIALSVATGLGIMTYVGIHLFTARDARAIPLPFAPFLVCGGIVFIAIDLLVGTPELVELW